MNKIIRHLLLCLACLMASTATATAKSKPIFLNNLFYSVNEADGTATLVKAPPQYDYYSNIIYDSILVIPDSVSYEDKKYVVTEIGDSAFYYYANIKNIQLPSTIKTIGNGAFYYSSIEEINLPEGLTVIADNAFCGCMSLDNVVLPESLDSIGHRAFSSCNKLSSIVIPNNTKHIGEWVFYSTGVEYVKLPDNMEVIPMRLLSSCYNLKSIELPKSVKKIGDAAFGSSGLTSINLHEGIEELERWAFSSTDLTEVCLPSTLKKMGVATFERCDKLEKVEFADGFEEIGERTFGHCDKLTTIVMPSSLRKIGRSSFEYCTALTEFTIPATLTEMEGNVFLESALKTLTLEPGNNSFKMEDGVLYSADGKEMYFITDSVNTEYVVPEGVERLAPYVLAGQKYMQGCKLPESLKEIGQGAFARCTSLLGIDIPENVSVIESKVFSYCDSLKEITLPDKVTEIRERCFDNCKSLSSVKHGDGIRSYGDYAFSYTAIRDYTVPEGVVELPYGLFMFCDSLNMVKLPSTLKVIGSYAFWGTGIREVVLPDGLREIGEGAFTRASFESINIPNSVETIGKQAFMSCKNLKSITLPTGLKQLGTYSLSYCESLESVTIAEGTITALPDYVFCNSTYLSEVNLPSTMRTIGNGCFANCKSLENIKLPESLKSIGGGTFQGCSFLSELELPEGLEGIHREAFVESGLKELRIPKSVKWLEVVCFVYAMELETVTIDAPLDVLPAWSFYGNTSLKNLYLCDGIERIGNYAMVQCPSIETLVLPSSLKYVEYGAVSNCSSLTTIQCNAVTPPDTDEEPFGEELYAQATLVVPQQSVEAYKNHPTWKKFFNIIGITTSVEGVDAAPAARQERIYNLKGQEMKTGKGFFIKNGIKELRMF